MYVQGCCVLPVISSSKIPLDAVEIDAQASENSGAVAGGGVEVRIVHEGDVVEAIECFLQQLSPTENNAQADSSLALTILAHSLGKACKQSPLRKISNVCLSK